MLTYVVYNHTSYLNVLRAQTSQLKSVRNKILMINKSDEELSDIYSQYEQVIFYDDTLPYATRLLELKKLNLKYILFIHDIDVVVSRDDKIINHLVVKMDELNIDRIDLQYQNIHLTHNTTGELIDIELSPTVEGTTLQTPYKWENVDDKRFYLIKQDDVNNYIYNVNPSIWKLSTFLEIMTQFKDETYRSIELPPTQLFCFQKGYRIYKIYGPYILNGFFCCMPFFQFIHVTHGGKVLALKNNNLDGPLYDMYVSIFNKFKLKEGRGFFEHSIESKRWCPQHYATL